MRFYCINETESRAVEVIDCTEVMATEVGECLQEALQEVWVINDTAITDLDIQIKLEHEINGKVLYQLVKEHGQVYQTGMFDKDKDKDKDKTDSILTDEFDKTSLESADSDEVILF